MLSAHTNEFSSKLDILINQNEDYFTGQEIDISAQTFFLSCKFS